MVKALCCSVLLALSASAATYAQTYPTKPVRIIVPFPPGGGTDIAARAVGQKLTDALGQTFIVDNRSGASGTIGSEAAAKAPPDGYTLGMAASSTHGAAPALYPKLGYDPLKDFAPVTLVVTTPFVVVVHPALPVKNVNELIALAKAQPGKLNYGSAGNGSSSQLTVEMFDLMAHVKTTHVPYKGAGPALVDLMGGQVDFMINDMSSLLGHVNAGKLRALAVTSSKRNPRLNVPALAETVPGYEAEAWYGLLAPAKTSPAIVSKLHEEIVKALRTTDLSDRLKAQGLDPVGSTPQEFLSYMQRDIAKWTKVVKAAGVKLD
ncbi:MAG: Bug family tripartite tricarboxylate transporter substrate binding protein [Burkholderiales bacterium]